jgi:hypothetical protein
MRRSCDDPLDERVDQIRGQVCVDGYRWHNNYNDEKTWEVINECIPISEEANIDGCSSALKALKNEVKRFNTSRNKGGDGGGQIPGTCYLNEGDGCRYGLGSGTLLAQVGAWDCKSFKAACDWMKEAKKNGTYQEWRGLVKDKNWTDRDSADAV